MRHSNRALAALSVPFVCATELLMLMMMRPPPERTVALEPTSRPGCISLAGRWVFYFHFCLLSLPINHNTGGAGDAGRPQDGASDVRARTCYQQAAFMNLT